MEDQWVNGCLTIYIERDVTCRIDNKDIMQRFQNNNPHRKQLYNFMCLGFCFFFCFVFNVDISSFLLF